MGDFYTEKLQLRVMAMFLSNQAEFIRFIDIIDEEYFDNIVIQGVFGTAVKFFKKYSRIPKIDELFNESLIVLQKIPEKEIGFIFESLVELMEDKENYDYVKDKVLDFARYQAVKNAVLKSAKELQGAKNYEKILKDVEKATMIGTDESDLGVFYFDNLENRLQRRIDGNIRKMIAIKTGVPSVDRNLDGGIAPPELGILMSPMKRGKTQTSVVFGTGALREGKNVLHIIFEGSQSDIEDLYDSSISGVPIKELRDREDEVREMVTEFKTNTHHVGKLKIKYAPAGKWSPFMIESYMHKIKARDDFEPDLVILDYLGLMKPSDSKLKIEASSGGRYYVLGAVTRELLAMCTKYNIAIWLVHQTTRQSGSKDIISMFDSGDSIEPMRDAHIILTLNQKDSEIEGSPLWQKMRIYVAGGRKVKMHQVANVLINKECCQIKDDDIRIDDNDDSGLHL